MKFLLKINASNPDEAKYLSELYSNHSAKYKEDSGLDLFIPKDIVILSKQTVLVDLGVQCQLRSIEPYIWRWVSNKNIWRYNSYNMYPRSSISKTPLFMANSVGLCDAAYLGNLKSALYNRSDDKIILKKGERYTQLARSDLGNISFQLVKDLRTTERGFMGFGSSGR
jgi:dUTP pyrophosphatase